MTIRNVSQGLRPLGRTLSWSLALLAPCALAGVFLVLGDFVPAFGALALASLLGLLWAADGVVAMWKGDQ